MKLFNKNIIIYFIVYISFTLFLEQNTISSLKTFSKLYETNFKSSKHKTKNKRKHKKLKLQNKIQQQANSTNSSFLPEEIEKNNNGSISYLDTRQTSSRFEIFDYKMLKHEIQDIFQFMLYKEENRVTPDSLRIFYEKFLKSFKVCDKDKSNTLDYTEFVGCLKNDTYFKNIIPPDYVYAARLVYTKEDGFFKPIFNFLDENNMNYINFQQFMLLRLYTFSWKHCSVFAPFINEVAFECAITIVGDFKLESNTKLRNLFFFALELSGNNVIRNVDFVSYIMFASSVRLYSHINHKLDKDIIRREFNLALDSGSLPVRYNQGTIEYFFRLIEENDKPDEGLDLKTFVFYDYHLQLFHKKNAKRLYYLDKQEWLGLINTNPLMLNITKTELLFTPEYNITSASYNMFSFADFDKFFSEQDYFMKFTQVENTKYSSKLNNKKSNNKNNIKNRKLKLKARSLLPSDLFNDQTRIHPTKSHTFNNTYNTTMSINNTGLRFWNIMDTDQDGWVNYYDFANIMQVLYLFGKFDPYLKGKISAGELGQKFADYRDLPLVGKHITSRAFRFHEYDKDLYFDPLSTSIMFKVDDLARYYFRKTDDQLLYEVELKRVLDLINMKYIPEPILNKCLRGLDDQQVPRYDWECAVRLGTNMNLNYYESLNSHRLTTFHNLTIDNTEFNNIDPRYN